VILNYSLLGGKSGLVVSAPQNSTATSEAPLREISLKNLSASPAFP